MLIRSTRVLVNDIFQPLTLSINNGIIEDILAYDYKDLMMIPGFYDFHVHGYAGYD